MVALTPLKCISCGKRAVSRDGDNFSCARCGFTWDVEHEKANANYLRAAHGREPYTSVFTADDAAAVTEMLVETANNGGDPASSQAPDTSGQPETASAAPPESGKPGKQKKQE